MVQSDDPEHFSLPSQETTSHSQQPVQTSSYIKEAAPIHINHPVQPQVAGPWTLTTLVEKFDNLSAVIDLTNTYKYYQPRYLKDCNVKHVKILTEGHVIPSKTVVRQ